MSESRVSEFFSGYAERFDAIYGNRDTLLNRLINRFLRRSMRLRFERTLAGCAPAAGKTILDVGCGPGHYGIALAGAGAASVLGLDVAPRMVALAREHAQRAGVVDRCRFVEQDVMALPAGQRFDHVIVMGVMDYVPDAPAFVAKVLDLTAHSAFFSFPAAGGFLAWQRKLRYRRRCPLYLYADADVRRAFEGACAFRVGVERLARDWLVTAART